MNRAEERKKGGPVVNKNMKEVIPADCQAVRFK